MIKSLPPSWKKARPPFPAPAIMHSLTDKEIEFLARRLRDPIIPLPAIHHARTEPIWWLIPSP